MIKTGQVGHVLLRGRRYAVQRNFGRTPADLPPARISQGAVESSGRVHVLRRGEPPPVIIYGPDGTFVRSYGAGEIFDSHGISIDAWDRVWIADRDAHQIVVFDLLGQPILRIGDRHRPQWEAPFNHPTRSARISKVQYRIQYLDGSANIIRELSADARSGMSAFELVADLPWVPRAVTMRVLDANGREVHSAIKGEVRG